MNALADLFASIQKPKEDDQIKPTVQQAIANANKVLKMKDQQDDDDAGKNNVKSLKKIHVEDDIENLNDLLEDDEKMEEDTRVRVKPTLEEIAEKDARTIFIGNVAVPETKNMKPLKKGLLAIFKKHGQVDSIRFRNIGFSKETLSAKINAISGNFHEKRDSLNAYVVFTEASTVTKALEENGTLFMGKHLRVDRARSFVNPRDAGNTLFLGNLPEDVTEEEIWDLFKSVGGIANVRAVRDKTGIGKGVAFVSFNLMEQLQLALKKQNAVIRGKKIRIQQAKSQNQLERIKSDKQVDKSAQQLAYKKRKVGGDQTPDKKRLRWQGDTATKGYIPRTLDKKGKKKTTSKKPRITFDDTRSKPTKSEGTEPSPAKAQESKKRSHVQFESQQTDQKNETKTTPKKKDRHRNRVPPTTEASPSKPALSKPATSKPVLSKPAISKPAPSKPAPSKPVSSRSVASKPVKPVSLDKKNPSYIKFGEEDKKSDRPAKKQKS